MKTEQMERTTRLLLYGIISGFLMASCGDGVTIDRYRGELKIDGKAVRINDCVLDDDGNAFFVGRLDVEASFGSNGTLVHKVDSKGKTIDTWIFNLGPEGLGIDITADNELILCGFAPTERERTHQYDRTQAVTVQKMLPNGTVIWKKVIPSLFNSVGKDIVALDDGSMIIVASHGRDGNDGMQLLKLSRKGDLLWTMEVMEGTHLEAYTLNKLPSGKIFIGGAAGNNGAFIMEINEDGAVLNSKMGSFADLSIVMSIAETSKGILVSGMSWSVRDAHKIVQFDDNLSVKKQGEIHCDTWRMSKIAVDKDDNVFFMGRSESDLMMVAKFNKQLKRKWLKEIPDTKLFESGGMCVSGNGNILCSGAHHTSGQSDWRGVYISFDQSGNYK